MIEKNKTSFKNFRNLDVYQGSYLASIKIMTKIIPKLPDIERNDLRNQMSRSCKAIPRLIAEGYAKKHQKKGFQKYLDDANGESNEMIV
jgi:four helix bundle protein